MAVKRLDATHGDALTLQNVLWLLLVVLLVVQHHDYDCRGWKELEGRGTKTVQE